MRQCVRLPPNRGVCGVDFPISMTINSTIFSFVTVNHAQDLMCLKFEALLMNKQHPIEHAQEVRLSSSLFPFQNIHPNCR